MNSLGALPFRPPLVAAASAWAICGCGAARMGGGGAVPVTDAAMAERCGVASVGAVRGWLPCSVATC